MTLLFLLVCRDIAWHAILPITCQTYVVLAYNSRFIKAKSRRGRSTRFYSHSSCERCGALESSRASRLSKHAYSALVTLLGLSLPALVGGSVIIEQIFTWPGMGRLFFESIRERDYPTIMGLTLMFSVLTLAGQLLADLLYSIVDPRVNVE